MNSLEQAEGNKYKNLFNMPLVKLSHALLETLMGKKNRLFQTHFYAFPGNLFITLSMFANLPKQNIQPL